MTIINTNLKALAAQESSRTSDLKMSQSMERLSTGLKINSAKDDAAGLAISNRMTAQIRGFAKAIQNTNDAISMTQTAGGALDNVTEILQRMRELAVQASTGTLNGSDRSYIQTEVASLRTQIDNIASTTNHNNIKLLNGTARNVTIQTGVNAGETMKLSFDSVATKDIGVGSKATLTAMGGLRSAGANFDALSVNALFLNGVAVGGTLAADDSASTADKASSAIAKVVAINRVADASGVYAKVGTTNVYGQAMTGTTTAQGTITINGVTTDQFGTTGDKALSRKNTVAAINAISNATGVTAVDTGDDKTGVALFASDGRNIVVTAGATHTSATLGIGAAGTYVGSYELYTLDGRDINVSSKTGATLALENSGLRAGSYKADTATTTTYGRSVAAKGAAPLSTTTGTLNGNTLIINGVAIGASNATDDTASVEAPTSGSRANSAIAIAAAINRSSDKTGVTATAAPNVLRGQGFTANVTAGQIYLNGAVISVNTSTINGVVDSINSVSQQTGVTASVWGGGVQLTATDGRNISLGLGKGMVAANIGLDGLYTFTAGTNAAPTISVVATFYSQVTLSSSNKFTLAAGSNGMDNFNNLGFRQGTFGGTDNGTKINQIDLSTASGASMAISAIDAALNTLNTQQANVGAYMNRLEKVVNNLSTSNQNMQASRSRILDTDYSTETTALAKQQIIQQAATAMLAQANQSAQSVLSLLK